MFKNISLRNLVIFLGVVAIITGVTLIIPSGSNKSKKKTISDTAHTVKSLVKDTIYFNANNFKYDTIGSQIISIKLCDSPAMSAKNVLITAGGYGAKLGWVEEWTKELYRSKLKDYNIGMIYIVPGPKEAYYESKEIPIPALARSLVDAYSKYKLNNTYLIAHSSGVFPAHQLFDLLYVGKPVEVVKNDSLIKKRESKKENKIKEKGERKSSKNKPKQSPTLLIAIDSLGLTKNKIIYIMLDGEPGIPRGYTLTKPMAESLRKIISVYAVDSTTNTKSGMYSEAVKIKKLFPKKTVDYLITAKKSGCAKGAKWCVHETLITTKPHNPKMYDLKNDYQLFDNDRHVVTEFMQAVDELDKPILDSLKTKQ